MGGRPAGGGCHTQDSRMSKFTPRAPGTSNRGDGAPARRQFAAVALAAAALLGTLTVSGTRPSLAAPTNATDSRPYDTKLLRLAELLGAIHYLRELCGANEGQFWRDTMTELMKSEGTTAIRRARLTRSFNQGYRNYSRTYNICTPTAQSTIERFLSEGAEIAETLAVSQ